MNKRQKLVQEQFLDNEEAVIRRLKAVYNQSLKDIEYKTKVLQNEINNLQAVYDAIDDEKERARLKSMQQSKIYQKGYQDALKKQVSSILDNMQVEEFETVADYLNKCYEEGFLGAVYDIHGQGIPVMFPLDQEAMVRAVQIDSKINKGLYQRLGEDVDLLKRKITAQVSRGISTGMTFEQVAQQLALHTNIGFNNAVRIARTEGHRIQVQSGMDACYKAKEKGADVVKQWDSTLDGNTRESHQQVDGEIRELDKPFSNGLMYPGDSSGGAAEVVNCRCALLQRAKWALDEQELVTLKERADYYGLDKSDNFKDFKKKYLKAVETDLAEYRVENYYKNNYSVDERLELTKALTTVSPKLKEAVKDTTFSVGRKGSCAYDKINDILYVAEGATKEEVIHEIGHAFENNILDKAKVDAVKKALIEGVTVNDIAIKTYYDAANNPVDIFVIDSDKFISEYQSRLYVNDISDAFDADGNIKIDCLLEVISETVREYYENGNNLLKHKELYELIKDAV